MKRPLIPALVFGLLAAGMVSALQYYGVLSRPQFAVTEFLSRHGALTKFVAARWQYVFIAIAALGVAWLTVQSARWVRIWWLVAALAIEVIAVSLICALYQTLFQPLPALLAIGLSSGFGCAYDIVTGGKRARLAAKMFSTRVSPQQLNRVVEANVALKPCASSHEATVMVCDIANKHDLAEDSAPETLAKTLDQFVRFARDVLLAQGAYLHLADGEGVVGIFGFPVDEAKHAEIASEAALNLQQRFGELRKTSADLFANCDLHLGISSGAIIAARLQNDHQIEIVPVGEPFELARRLCIANRVYGSHILLGPRAFELAEKAIVARPIDFLGAALSGDRLEIYELLSLAKTARAEDVARRDNFWNGVVYYRERRWEEAYAAFQKSWGENGPEDAPLQLYLRRLEPLVLHLTESPSPSEPLPF